jgi:hypothetical protein
MGPDGDWNELACPHSTTWISPVAVSYINLRMANAVRLIPELALIGLYGPM